MNYTEETTEYIKSRYAEEPTRETVEELASELGKPVKSIIGKLSKEGVYRRQGYLTKRGEKPVTKLEMVEDICLALNVESLDGLEKTPKETLKKLRNELARNAQL